MISSCRAAYSVATNMSDMALPAVVGPVPNICATTPGANTSGAGGALTSDSICSPVSAIQVLKNRCCACRTTGPSQRSRMSTQGAKRAATRNSGSAQFWLPQKAMRLSMTATLRWLRKSSRPTARWPRRGMSSSVASTRTPASCNCRQRGERMKAREPSASTITRQATPRRAAAQTASAIWPPWWSSSQM